MSGWPSEKNCLMWARSYLHECLKFLKFKEVDKCDFLFSYT